MVPSPHHLSLPSMLGNPPGSGARPDEGTLARGGEWNLPLPPSLLCRCPRLYLAQTGRPARPRLPTGPELSSSFMQLKH